MHDIHVQCTHYISHCIRNKYYIIWDVPWLYLTGRENKKTVFKMISCIIAPGTTWLQEIIYLVCNNADTETAKNTYLYERSQYIESTIPIKPNDDHVLQLDYMNAQKPPHLIKTHLPDESVVFQAHSDNEQDKGRSPNSQPQGCARIIVSFLSNVTCPWELSGHVGWIFPVPVYEEATILWRLFRLLPGLVAV